MAEHGKKVILCHPPAMLLQPGIYDLPLFRPGGQTPDIPPVAIFNFPEVLTVGGDSARPRRESLTGSMEKSGEEHSPLGIVPRDKAETTRGRAMPEVATAGAVTLAGTGLQRETQSARRAAPELYRDVLPPGIAEAGRRLAAHTGGSLQRRVPAYGVSAVSDARGSVAMNQFAGLTVRLGG
jgi:hypothetical protein